MEVQGQSWLPGQMEPGAATRDSLSQVTDVGDTKVTEKMAGKFRALGAK